MRHFSVLASQPHIHTLRRHRSKLDGKRSHGGTSSSTQSRNIQQIGLRRSVESHEEREGLQHHFFSFGERTYVRMRAGLRARPPETQAARYWRSQRLAAHGADRVDSFLLGPAKMSEPSSSYGLPTRMTGSVIVPLWRSTYSESFHDIRRIITKPLALIMTSGFSGTIYVFRRTNASPSPRFS